MKAILTLILGCLAATSVAYGPRGVAERMLYYYAYICEEETKALDPSYQYKVAPGCQGDKPKRCTLDELLVYIWSAKADSNPPDTTRPTGMSKGTGVSGRPNMSFNQLEAKVRDARFNTGAMCEGNVDREKLWPGSTSWYDCLSKMGGPMEAFNQAVRKAVADSPTDANGKHTFKVQYRPKLWATAKAASQFVAALRRHDLDDYRTKWFREHIPGIDIVHVPINTAKLSSNGQPVGDITAIDFDQTISRNSGINNIEGTLTTENHNFFAFLRNGEALNENHRSAYNAGLAAMAGCNCEMPIPRNLKKRGANATATTDNLLAGVNLAAIPLPTTLDQALVIGGPKAIKSRLLREKRLAQMGVQL
ncbi:hypothetical protein NLG97_g5185 [Lecanicillium saksenae]|uniref:Uncharacterized protein n=1 Tax=Lecanicillium saksenae TaxID=468837 RepID=A0ACC1QUW6_9HYPO|nr:hypothetical protein NLG97_g5185 [Lecanicillium saksenae]